MKKLIVSVDIGGTFTDIVGVDETGLIFLEKVPSTPTDQSIGLIQGIEKLIERNLLDKNNISKVAHGTTVATNTLLEHYGAKTALITTKGFRDVLYIGRQSRPNLYSLRIEKPEALVPRHLRSEVSERVLFTGEIQEELDESELIDIVQEHVAQGVESVAVCFLHSYINPINENRALQVINERFPHLKVTLSSQILPEFREFERTIATVINAYVHPKMEKYIMKLRSRLNKAEIGAPLLIMKSSGGMMTDQTASQNCVYTLLSGPAGGVLGTENFAKLSQHKNLICCDMGGTSFDVSVLIDGRSGIKNEGEIEGYPIRFPHIDIATIGAGGGSIAWLDSGGALRVGPKSAGSDPGPVCYSRGGKEPTITDANLVLGYIGKKICGGSVELNDKSARDTIEKKFCSQIEKNIEETALGILRVANASMVRAIRKLTIERGIDPRKFSIFAYGGAGPLHAVELARSLSINNVIVPFAPGNFSALGILVAPIRYDEVISLIIQQQDLDLGQINLYLTDLFNKASRELDRDQIEKDSAEFKYSADLRYLDQDYTINIPIVQPQIDSEILLEVISSFHTRHLQEYGFRKDNDPVELVNLRLTVSVRENSIQFKKEQGPRDSSGASKIETRKAYFNGKWLDLQVYNRPDLPPGFRATGPAVIEELGSTTLIGPKDSLVIENDLSILIRVNQN